MKYIRQNPPPGLRYIWSSREVDARCLNQTARMLPGEAYVFAQMAREGTNWMEAMGAVFEIIEDSK